MGLAWSLTLKGWVKFHRREAELEGKWVGRACGVCEPRRWTGAQFPGKSLEEWLPVPPTRHIPRCPPENLTPLLLGIYSQLLPVIILTVKRLLLDMIVCMCACVLACVHVCVISLEGGL